MPDISRLVIEVNSAGVVTATGNLEKFSTAGQKAGKSTDDISNKFSKSKKETDNLAKSFGAFQLVINKLPGPLQNIAGGLLGLVSPGTAAIGMFIDITEAAINFGRESLQTFAQFEMLKANLETVTGSAEAAGTMFKELQDMSAGSTFGVEQLSQVATMLTQAGISANNLIPTLRMLGDVSMGSAEKFNSVAFNFAQVAGTGKATAMDIRQFQLAGVPIAKLLENIGRAGDNSFSAITEAITTATSEGGMFFDAMGRGAETLSGKTNALETAWKNLQNTIAEETPLGNVAKIITGAKTDLINLIDRDIKGDVDFWKEVFAPTAEETGKLNISPEMAAGLQKFIKENNMETAPIEEWVKILSQSTGYSLQDVGGTWNSALKKYSGGMNGLGTVTKYVTEQMDSLNRTLSETSKDGNLLYEALGFDKTTLIEESAQRIRTVLNDMLNSKQWNGTEESVQHLIDSLQRLEDMKPKEEKVIAGIESPAVENVVDTGGEEVDIFGQDFAALQKKLALMKEYGTAYQEQMKLQEYTDIYGEGNAEKIIALEDEIEKEQALIDKTLALNDALNQLKEAGIQLAAGSLVSFANDLGNAFRDGAISGDEFSGALKNMLRSLIDAMPQLLLNIELRLLPTNLALGLAFIGASGLMSFVSGLIGDTEQDSKNDEAERLRNIQRQIEDLLESQRKQQEYYLTQKRKVDSTAVSVNDAIITPRGTVYTHPEDYIIATKTPETLMGGGGSSVVVQIINNTGAQISQREGMGADGSREIQVTIDRIVQNGIASGRYDGAFNVMNVKNQARKVTN